MKLKVTTERYYVKKGANEMNENAMDIKKEKIRMYRLRIQEINEATKLAKK